MSCNPTLYIWWYPLRDHVGDWLLLKWISFTVVQIPSQLSFKTCESYGTIFKSASKHRGEKKKVLKCHGSEALFFGSGALGGQNWLNTVNNPKICVAPLFDPCPNLPERSVPQRLLDAHQWQTAMRDKSDETETCIKINTYVYMYYIYYIYILIYVYIYYVCIICIYTYMIFSTQTTGILSHNQLHGSRLAELSLCKCPVRC